MKDFKNIKLKPLFGREGGRGAEAAGDFLFDLGHTHRLLAEVVGDGNPGIGHKAPDILGVEAAQAVDETDRLNRSMPMGPTIPAKRMT